MNTNVNFNAAVGVLLFLGTCLVMLVAALFVLYGLIVRKFGRVLVTLVGVSVALGLYLGLMLLFSLSSTEKVLARGEEKHFCEIDCHLAYSVVNVRRAKALGGPPDQTSAKGDYYVVTVRTRFDETTIAPWRGNGLLRPNNRVVMISDDRGRRYGLSRERGTPLTTPLRPGESYTTELVFDLPPEARNPVLSIREDLFPTLFIIGHENSFWHKQTKFRLEPLAEQAGTTAHPRKEG